VRAQSRENPLLVDALLNTNVAESAEFQSELRKQLEAIDFDDDDDDDDDDE